MRGQEQQRRHQLSHLSQQHTMQLKVNRHQQKQEKVHFYPFFSSFLTRGLVYWTLWSFLPLLLLLPPPPPCWLFAFPDNVMQVDNIEDEQSRHHRGGCCTGEVKIYSFQIGFSPWFTICWIVLIHGAESGVRSGRGRQPRARKTIESVREEPSAHQINSSRRREAGLGGGLSDTCLSDGDYFPALSDALPPFQSDLAWRHIHITVNYRR